MHKKLLIIGMMIILILWLLNTLSAVDFDRCYALGQTYSDGSYTFAKAEFPYWIEGLFLLLMVGVILFFVGLIVVLVYLGIAFAPHYEKSESIEEYGRHCKGCGKGIPETARFCPYCNKKFW